MSAIDFISASAAGTSIPGAAPSIRAGLAKAKQLAASRHAAERHRGQRDLLQHPCRRRPSPNGRRACPTASASRSRPRASAPTARMLGEAAESIGKFCAQGFTELGDKLGPILWQLAPTKKFDADEIRAFLTLLPTSRDGITLRHALEVRHESFKMQGVRRAGPRVERRDRLRRSRNLSRDGRSHRRLRLCAAAAGERRRSRPAMRLRRSTAGPRWRKAGRRARARPACIMSPMRPRRERRARSSPSSSPATRSAIPPPPRR